MNISEELTKHQQYAVISILIKIMEADGIIDPHEIKFMNQVLEEFHISEREIEDINTYDLPKAISELRGLDTRIKETITKLFLGMAECDGYVDPREIDIINGLRF